LIQPLQRADGTLLLLGATAGNVFVNATTPKPAMLVCKDLFAHVHAATDARMYSRADDWFVKLTVPGGFVLIAWTVAAPHNAKVLTGGPVVWNIAGNAVKTALPGPGAINLMLARRSIAITSPADFPEFYP
jgi:hypothetical protein